MTRILLLTLSLGLAATALADQGTQNMTGKKELAMLHCPSAVPGTLTRVRDVADGVVLTLSAPEDPVAQQELRRRVQYQLEIVDQPERGAIEHTGLGTGSGRYGFCPGMMEGTSLAVQWTSDGAVLTIRADEPAKVERLQRSTHKRLRALDARLRKLAGS
jgi:hypothetical protein